MVCNTRFARKEGKMKYLNGEKKGQGRVISLGLDEVESNPIIVLFQIVHVKRLLS